MTGLPMSLRPSSSGNLALIDSSGVLVISIGIGTFVGVEAKLLVRPLLALRSKLRRR